MVDKLPVVRFAMLLSEDDLVNVANAIEPVSAAAVLVWLGIVLVWFVLTVLRGRRERFAAGMLAAAGLVRLPRSTR